MMVEFFISPLFALHVYLSSTPPPSPRSIHAYLYSSPAGAIAGALAARYIAPALLWGGIVGESEGILPDSNAKSWAKRREMLTNQYVANLAAKAQGQASFGESVAGNVKQPGDALYASVASDADVDNDGVAKNLSQLSAGALQVCF